MVSAKKMIPYGQMEELLKATQLEMTRLLQVCEEQRMALGAELLNANQRLQALKTMETVSECTDEEKGSGAFGASKSMQDDEDDEPRSEPSQQGFLIHSTTKPSSMAEMCDDKPPSMEPSAAQAPKRPSTRSERDAKSKSERPRRPSDRGRSPKESPQVTKSPSNISQNSNMSDVNSDYSACESAYSDGSYASCTFEADWDDDNDKRKRKKRSRRSGQKKRTRPSASF